MEFLTPQRTDVVESTSKELSSLSMSDSKTPTPPAVAISHYTTSFSSIEEDGDGDDDAEIPVDPSSDINNPRKVTFEEISAAAFMIQSGIIHTPLMLSHLSDFLDMDIYLKKEFLQYTGSFKERGARYALLKLSKEQRKIGVIAASAGNYALALAYHGKTLNIPVTVVCPVYAPLMKIQQCSVFGAEVIVHGRNFDASYSFALRMAKERGLLYINGFDHPHIIAGQGTTGLEILHDCPDVDAVLVGVGGGGLISGVGLAVKTLNPDIEVIGVEAERCPGFTESMKAGQPTEVTNHPSLADGLAVGLVGPNSFVTAKSHVDRMITVSEDYIALAILRMVEMEKAVVEGAGAVCIAALLQGKLPHLVGKKVVCILSGGNIDTTVLGRCLDRGLAADGRLMRIVVYVTDRPGGIAEVAGIIAKKQACIKDIFHERAWVRGDVFGVKVTVVVETRDVDHSEEILREIQSKFEQVESTIESSAAFVKLKKSKGRSPRSPAKINVQ